ncbi:helix-turn-helix domain-containing protein [Pseudoflavitalea rhizosphaerae]|uniref:helix-turn-helix domain-containing protein n=1 Tax=Pseudoflavitalea rhizosphaerae TaxID=1884793 RepID=UPI000F8E7F22|nr:AraC family transcriptional regulator [Pseudoflavitalea rhizosphaerae]
MLKEITPLTSSDCFTIFTRTKSEFNFPLHYHEELELNLVINAKGARRIVGSVMEEIDDIDLVLVGSNLPHAWKNHKCESKEIHEITVQFHKDLFDEKMLRRNQLHFIREMFERSKCGILFSRETAKALSGRLKDLQTRQGFDSVMELMSILHDLSVSRNARLISDAAFAQIQPSHNSRRVERVIEYINQNFDKSVQLSDAAKLANMTKVSFSRFFKAQTGMNFIDSLLEIRLGHASRLLIDTNRSIAEVAYHCGFNNISNFNRLFKKKKGCTPKEFRENYTYEKRVFI